MMVRLSSFVIAPDVARLTVLHPLSLRKRTVRPFALSGKSKCLSTGYLLQLLLCFGFHESSRFVHCSHVRAANVIDLDRKGSVCRPLQPITHGLIDKGLQDTH